MSDKLNPSMIYDYIISRLEAIKAQQPDRVCVFYLLLGSYPGYYLENPTDESRLHCCPQIIPSLDSYIANMHQEVIHCDEFYKLKPQTVLDQHTHRPQTAGNTFNQNILDCRFPMHYMRIFLDRLSALPAFFYIQNTTGIPYAFDEFQYMEQHPTIYITESNCMLNTLSPMQLPSLDIARMAWVNPIIPDYIIKYIEIPLLINICKCIIMSETVNHITIRDRPPLCIATEVVFDPIMPWELNYHFEIYVRPYLFHRMAGNIHEKYMPKYLSDYLELANSLSVDTGAVASVINTRLEYLSQVSPEIQLVCASIHQMSQSYLEQMTAPNNQTQLIKFLILVLTIRQLQVTDSSAVLRYLPGIDAVYQLLLSSSEDHLKDLKTALYAWPENL